MSEHRLEPQAGEIWLIDMDPQVGREQGGIRPALVVSNDYFNGIPNDLFVVVPTTTRNRGYRLHIPVEPPTGGLRRPSVIMCDQVKAASRKRFLERWGVVDDETLERVRGVIALIFANDRPVKPESGEAG